MDSFEYRFMVESLFKKYNSFILDNKQTADELNLSESRFAVYRAKGRAPKEMRSEGKVLFTIFDVASWIIGQRVEEVLD